jgi:hypothetical protein
MRGSLGVNPRPVIPPGPGCFVRCFLGRAIGPASAVLAFFRSAAPSALHGVSSAIPSAMRYRISEVRAQGGIFHPGRAPAGCSGYPRSGACSSSLTTPRSRLAASIRSTLGYAFPKYRSIRLPHHLRQIPLLCAGGPRLPHPERVLCEMTGRTGRRKGGGGVVRHVLTQHKALRPSNECSTPCSFASQATTRRRGGRWRGSLTFF